MASWPFDQVVCFGDSITEGYMVDEESSYPARLSKILNLKCINLGVSGDTSSAGLRRLGQLDEAIGAGQRSVVLIEFGINDFFMLYPRSETKANLERLINHIREKGQGPILIGFSMDYPGVPQWVSLYEELSEAQEVPLYPNVFHGLSKREGDFLSDGLHPSPSGYQKIAQGIGGFLRDIFDNK